MRVTVHFFLTQPVSYSFAFRVSCKVKYFGKVANVRIRGKDNVHSCVSQPFLSLSLTSYQLLSRQLVSKRPKQSTQKNRF